MWVQYTYQVWLRGDARLQLLRNRRRCCCRRSKRRGRLRCAVIVTVLESCSRRRARRVEPDPRSRRIRITRSSPLRRRRGTPPGPCVTRRIKTCEEQKRGDRNANWSGGACLERGESSLQSAGSLTPTVTDIVASLIAAPLIGRLAPSVVLSRLEVPSARNCLGNAGLLSFWILFLDELGGLL